MMPLLKICLRATALLATLSLAQAQAPEARTALVVGNADYSFGPLKNPVHDAEAMAKSLKEAGFDVMIETDADHAKLQKVLHTFGDELKARGGVGLFYFSGHGAQISGENYLLPTGDEIADIDDVKTRSLTATEIVDAMDAAHNNLNIVILDACRTNPIDPNGTHGLSRIDSSASLFVSYATSPGAVALDGAGNNSPYAKYLSQSIAAPNLSIEDTFKRTLKGVYVDTHGEQTPWISSTFFGEFVFRPNDASAPPAASGSPPSAQSAPSSDIQSKLQGALLGAVHPLSSSPEPSIELGGIYRVTGTNPTGSEYHGMVALMQKADQFNLTWWIGKDVFHGTGHFAGKMLVVNYGEKDPVIYSFGGDGALDGEWADGSAKETLEPFGTAAPKNIDLGDGEYKVEGQTPVGSDYTGTVKIAKEPKGYQLTWHVGDTSYQGTGTLAGNLLTVDWGSSTPVVYALGTNGSLAGLWDAGKGEETLTPDR
jgi:Caspase domain